MSWIVTHGELEVLSPDIVQGLVSDVFQNPEKGSFCPHSPTSRLFFKCPLLMHCALCKCRWPKRADTVGAGAAVHRPYPACAFSLPRASQGAYSIWLVRQSVQPFDENLGIVGVNNATGRPRPTSLPGGR